MQNVVYVKGRPAILLLRTLKSKTYIVRYLDTRQIDQVSPKDISFYRLAVSLN